jgi:DNA repair exonuclease SbcCD ATPase subunit
MTEQKKTPTVPILICIIIALLGVIGYLLFSSSEKSDLIAKQENKIEADSATINAKVKELEELNLALTRAKMEMDELGKSNDTLNQQLAQLNEYIKQVKAGNAKQINNLTSKLSEYKKLLEVKDQEITSLRAKTDSLTTEVGTLNQQKSQMNDSIASLNTVKSELAQQVAIASILKAENVRITAINKKDKELSKDEYKAKDVVKLKVLFNLGDNKVARKDNKQIIFRLIEPSGSVLYDAATGGGFFNVDGKDLPYTDKKSVKFDNSKQQVGFVYVKGSEYKSGTYTVEIYGDGTKIGESQFTVK